MLQNTFTTIFDIFEITFQLCSVGSKVMSSINYTKQPWMVTMIVKTKIQIQYEIYPADKMLYRYLMNKVFVSYINPFLNTFNELELNRL